MSINFKDLFSHVHKIFLYLGNGFLTTILTYFYGDVFTMFFLDSIFICPIQSPTDMDCLGEVVSAQVTSYLLFLLITIISISVIYRYLSRYSFK